MQFETSDDFNKDLQKLTNIHNVVLMPRLVIQGNSVAHVIDAIKKSNIIQPNA
jgi:hypothetical protein